MNIDPEKTGKAEKPSFNDIVANFPVMDVIECGDQTITVLRHDMDKVIPFLEYLVSGRYYPPLSFVVDEHTIRTVHKIMISHCCDRLDEIQSSSETENIIEILSAFDHSFDDDLPLWRWIDRPDDKYVCPKCGQIADYIIPRDTLNQIEEFLDALSDQERREYKHFYKRIKWILDCRRFPHTPVHKYLLGHDLVKDQNLSMQSYLEAVARNEHRGDSIKEMLQWILDVASKEDSKLARCAMTEEILKDLSWSRTSDQARAARNLLHTVIPQLACKYQVCLYFDKLDRTELRLCRTFPEYFTKLCSRWLSYIDIVLRKRGDVTIGICLEVSRTALDWLKRELPSVQICQFEVEVPYHVEKKEPCYHLHLKLSDYKICVQHLSGLLIKIFDQRDYYIGHTLLPFTATTYGAFLPASAVQAHYQFEKTLIKYGWPKQAGLPGQGKILVCIDAVKRIKEKLYNSSSNEYRDIVLAHRIALAVLVHEHFHAAIATALDYDGRPPLGSQRLDYWQKGIALNEALATWAERHFFRHDLEMSEHIENYVRSGVYPSWPYSGAEYIERIYQSGGIPQSADG